MKKRFSILVVGNGRIAQAAFFFLKRSRLIKKVAFFSPQQNPRHFDLFIGCLAGEIGERCLELAIRYRKNLIDISDVDPPFYLRKKKEIEKCGISVIPGCGFSPGIVNFLIGRELSRLDGVTGVEVKAGSLSLQPYYYPFLWCFEDLILEHRLSSWQVIAGKRKKLAPFAGYQKERLYGIEAESYYSASGFENMMDAQGNQDFTCRVIRPHGFRTFFKFLSNSGFLEEPHRDTTKLILEGKRQENLTIAEITFKTRQRRLIWRLKSFSDKGERLNSMQKITASVSAIVSEWLLKDKLDKHGLVFMDDLGKNSTLGDLLLSGIRKRGISAQRLSKRG